MAQKGGGEKIILGVLGPGQRGRIVAGTKNCGEMIWLLLLLKASEGVGLVLLRRRGGYLG